MYPLAEGMFAPRNEWYVAAWSSEVDRAPRERWILNEPVALYRTEAGRAVALAGRCPHRHFPLGKSRVVGDDIECGYHGITFAPDGSCVRIPSQLQIPAVCRVRAYPLVERWQWLWIWMGDPALADESRIPDHVELGLTNPGYDTVGDIYYPVPGRYHLMHDNLLDLSHLAFLHKTTIASAGVAEAQEERADGPDWTRSTRRMNGVDCPPFFSAAFGYHGAVDRRFGLTFYLPCVHAGFDEFRRTAAGGSGEYLGSIRVYHAVTPGRLHDAHYFFALGRDFARGDVEFSNTMVNGLRLTLEEDMSATREIEAMLQGLGEVPREMLLRSDTHCVMGRRRLEEMIRKEQVLASAPAAERAAR